MSITSGPLSARDCAPWFPFRALPEAGGISLILTRNSSPLSASQPQDRGPRAGSASRLRLSKAVGDAKPQAACGRGSVLGTHHLLLHFLQGTRSPRFLVIPNFLHGRTMFRMAG